MKMPWSKVPIGEFLTPSREAISIQDDLEYKQLTIALHGRGIHLRQIVLGKAIKTKNQYLARAGQFIYSRIDARNGAMGIVPDELDGAAISGDFPTFVFDQDKIEPEFFECMTKTISFEETCRAPSRGVTNRKRLKESEFMAICVPLPPLHEQQRIVDKIKRVIARVEEAKRMTEEIEKEQTSLLLRQVEEISKNAPRMPMAEVAPIVRRQVEIKLDDWYPELGIRSFGKGTFHKKAIKGSNVGNKRLYKIHPGDLLFSNVFSWEGAIAVARPEDKGRFGSHRFITCVSDSKRATARFLCYWFLTDEGLIYIRAASPGSAGRNKTLGIKKLEEIQVPLPPIKEQQRFDNLVVQINRARVAHQKTSTDLEHLISALLDQAFHGDNGE